MNGQALLSVVDHEARELHDVPGKMLPVLPICILLFITVKQVSVVNHRKSPDFFVRFSCEAARIG